MDKKELSKDSRIKREYNKIKKPFRTLPKEKLSTVENLFKNAAFMAVALQDLQEIINEKGYTEVYQNGKNQEGVKASAELQSYNQTLKSYTIVMKQLIALLPEKQRSSGLAEVMERLNDD